MRLLILASFTLVSTCWAQVGAPLLGYFPDHGRIRPARGIAGSSTVDEPMPGEFQRIAAAPSGDFLLVSAVDSGAVSVLRPGVGLIGVKGATPAPDRIVLSPRGNAAALWFDGNKRIQLIKGLPDSPEIREIDAAFLGDAPEALAVNDGAEWVAGVWADGLHAFGPDGQANFLPLEGTKRTLAFFHGSRDLAIASSAGLHKVTDVGGRSEIGILMGGGGLDPMAVNTSADNRRIVLLETGGRLTSIEMEGGATRRIECACAAEGLFRLSKSVFRLTGLESRSFRLFDSETGDLLFAPLTAPEGEQQ